VEDKLKLKLPRKVIEATRASLRVLKIRYPIGSFGKAFDNETKRACALLEYAVRDHDSSIDISMDQLAKASLMKLKDFCEFHKKIGNFRVDVTVTTSSTSAKVTKKSLDEISNAKNRRNSSSSIVFKKSSIPFLAIQLGAFVPNSSDVAKHAQHYFQDIVDFLQNSSNKGGVHGLWDIQRNQFSYEAACFYLIATSGCEHDNINNNNNSTTNRRRRSTTGIKLHGDDDEEDDNRQLDLSTFLDVTKAPTQFQTVLGYVKELRDDIESRRVDSSTLESSSSRLSSSKSSSKSYSRTESTASRKRLRKETFDSSVATISSSKKDSNNELSGSKRRYYSRQNPVFDEWKRKILLAACQESKETIQNKKGDEFCNNDHKPKRVLDFVAGKILAGYGMVRML